MPSVKRRMVDNWPALLTSIGVSQRLAVACRGRLSALLVAKLIRFGSDRAFKRALKHAAAVMSRGLGLFSKCGPKHNCWVLAPNPDARNLCFQSRALCNLTHPPSHTFRPALPLQMSINLCSHAFTPLPDVPGQFTLPPAASKKQKTKVKW